MPQLNNKNIIRVIDIVVLFILLKVFMGRV